MEEQLMSFIEGIKNDKKIQSFNEAETKQAIVLPLLSLLGWDTCNIDEVKPECSVESERVDYSLRIDNDNKVFIEVKKLDTKLERYDGQLLNYSFKEGVKLWILTNGITWWFYLPLREGTWKQRNFYTVDILQQESKDIVSKFIDFLSKDNIKSEKAIEIAEAICKGQQKKNVLKQTLPKAWDKIISEPDELLIKLINETTEKLCGFKADTELIEEFLVEHKEQFLISPAQPNAPNQAIGNYSGKSISSFYFRGTQYRVRFWKDLLIRLCEILNTLHETEFDKILSLRGRKWQYFSRNENELLKPRKIAKTDIFVETNFSSNSIVKLCYDVLDIFGYSGNDLRIETK